MQLSASKPPLADIQAIVFDLDNTLWDVAPTIERAEQNTYRYLQEHYPRITQKFTFEDIRNLREKIYWSRIDIQHDLTEVRRQTLAYLFQQCGCSKSGVEKTIDRFLVDRNRVSLYSDVIPALTVLSSIYPLVSLSDGNSDLKQIGIQHFFVGSVSSASVGHCKPHSVGFLKACEIAKSKPRHTLHIGDHPHKDVYGAKAVGMKTILIQRNGESWDNDFDPDYRVRSLTEMVALLV